MNFTLSIRSIKSLKLSKSFSSKSRLNSSPIKETPKVLKGQKPHFKNELDSKYFEFSRLEKELYEWWESEGYFKPDMKSKKKPFIIPMPPPNVTGYLHMG
jgi:valyl-tRNA synthetase